MSQSAEVLAAAHARREKVLDLWTKGHTEREISDRIPGTTKDAVKGILARARQAGDERAVRRDGRRASECDDLPNLEGRSERDAVLDLRAAGLIYEEIAAQTGIWRNRVRYIVERAWADDGDPRAAPRTRRSVVEFACSDAQRDWSRDTYQPAVPLAPVRFAGTAESLRPIAYSIDRQRDLPRSLTAAILGDPSPERSALQREIRPDEYASGREGGYRDSRKPRRRQTATETAAIAARFIRWREERRGKEG